MSSGLQAKKLTTHGELELEFDDLENALDSGARLVEGLLGDPVGADPGEGAVGGLVEGLLGHSVGDLVEGHLGDFGVDPCESV